MQIPGTTRARCACQSMPLAKCRKINSALLVAFEVLVEETPKYLHCKSVSVGLELCSRPMKLPHKYLTSYRFAKQTHTNIVRELVSKKSLVATIEAKRQQHNFFQRKNHRVPGLTCPPAPPSHTAVCNANTLPTHAPPGQDKLSGQPTTTTVYPLSSG